MIKVSQKHSIHTEESSSSPLSWPLFEDLAAFGIFTRHLLSRRDGEGLIARGGQCKRMVSGTWWRMQRTVTLIVCHVQPNARASATKHRQAHSAEMLLFSCCICYVIRKSIHSYQETIYTQDQSIPNISAFFIFNF